MKITIIIASDKLNGFGRIDLQDPLVARTFIENPDMNQRFEDFMSGDWEALSKPGIVLLSEISGPKDPKTMKPLEIYK